MLIVRKLKITNGSLLEAERAGDALYFDYSQVYHGHRLAGVGSRPWGLLLK